LNFLQELKKTFAEKKYEIGVEIDGKYDLIFKYDIPNINKYADYIYFYPSNYHYNWEDVTAAMSPLYSSDPNDNYTVVS
jgi:GH18 family chitinase